MRSESVQKCEKLVVRSKASDSSRLWIHFVQGGLLHLQLHHKAWLAMKLCRANFDNFPFMQGAGQYVSEYSRTRDSGEGCVA